MQMRLKQIFGIIICVVLFMSLCVSPMGVSAESEKKPIKILAIGNSYSCNTTEYISRIAESMGLDITGACLYYQGCMLDRHIRHYEAYEKLGHDAYYAGGNNDKYEAFYVNGVSSMDNRSIQEAVAYTDWDYITLQQTPNSCDNIDKYWTPTNPDLTTLYEYVKAELNKNGNKKCEILLNQGWSFSLAMSTNNAYVYYPVDYDNTKDFFEKIEETVNKAAEIVKEQEGLKKPLDIVPSGKAVQLAKDEFGFGDTYGDDDSLYADYISHMSNAGRYLTGCVWIETFAAKSGMKVDTRKATYLPSGVTKDMATALASCAHEAVTGEQDSVYGDFRAVPYRNGLKLTHFVGTVPSDGNVKIPSKIGDEQVLCIDDTLFKYVEGVNSVTMEGGITIENGALNNIELIEDIITADKSNLNNEKDEDDASPKIKPEIIVLAVIGAAALLLIGAAVVLGIMFLKK